MSRPLLSILTPACWERGSGVLLRDEIKEQIDRMNDPCCVEHLVLLDNRTRSVGLKRQALLDSALGDYIAFVDDDDLVSIDYIEQITAMIQLTDADVITFEQDAFYNDLHSKVIFNLDTPDEPYNPGGITQRNIWHVCAIKRTIAQRGIFPDIMDGEDLAWCQQIRPFLRTQHHIPRILHTYRFNATTTLASGKNNP